MGVVLAYCWAAYPFTLYAMNSNTNDSLVGADTGRGAAGDRLRAGPRHHGPGRRDGEVRAVRPGSSPVARRRRSSRAAASDRRVHGGIRVGAVSVMLPVLAHRDLSVLWRDSVAYQSNRVTPFSVWGLWGGLSIVQNLLQGAAVALALGVAFIPSRRAIMEVAALGAAVLLRASDHPQLLAVSVHRLVLSRWSSSPWWRRTRIAPSRSNRSRRPLSRRRAGRIHMASSSRLRKRRPARPRPSTRRRLPDPGRSRGQQRLDRRRSKRLVRPP